MADDSGALGKTPPRVNGRQTQLDDIRSAVVYAARKGVATKEIIAEAEALEEMKIDEKGWNERAFNLLSLLAATIRPATIEGLQFVEGLSSTPRNIGIIRRTWKWLVGSSATWMLREFRIHTLLVFLLLLILQLFSASSAYLLGSYDKAQKEYETVKGEIDRLKSVEGGKHEAVKYPEIYQRKGRAETKLESAKYLINGYDRWIRWGARSLVNLSNGQLACPSEERGGDCATASKNVPQNDKELAKKKAEEEVKAAENDKLIRTSAPDRLRSIGEMVSNYLLPVFYGWLGACIYVVRHLTVQFDNSSFSLSSRYMFRLRILLGLILGGLVSLFIPSDALSGFNLSIAATAFLVGYSVEVIFSLLDSWVEKLKGWAASNASAQGSNKEKV